MDSYELKFKDIAMAIKKKVEGPVRFDELFPDGFIQKHSDFKSLKQLFEHGGFDCRRPEQLYALDMKRLDKYISENTDFESWKDMKLAAEVALVLRKIKAD